MLINITVTGILEKSSGREFQARNSSSMVYPIHHVKGWKSRFRGVYRDPHNIWQDHLLILVKGFQSLYNVTRSSGLVFGGVLHLPLHFIIILRKLMGKPWGFSVQDAILYQNSRMSHEKQLKDLYIYVKSGVILYPQPRIHTVGWAWSRVAA